ncbi:MAG: winged helix-turn-helix domain-containing protein [Gammaproteobacteria bacterium]
MSSQPRRNAAPASVVRPRVYINPELTLGPGKIDLLRAVGASGSISGAARELGMSYKRAWLLIETLNRGFGQPVTATARGGKGGGGAGLTKLGETLIKEYDAIEAACTAATRGNLRSLVALAHTRLK